MNPSEPHAGEGTAGDALFVARARIRTPSSSIENRSLFGKLPALSLGSGGSGMLGPSRSRPQELPARPLDARLRKSTLWGIMLRHTLVAMSAFPLGSSGTRRVISLYTGVGGLDLGLEAAGFQVAVAVDADRDAVSVIRGNRDWPVVCDNQGAPKRIEAVESGELIQCARLRVGEASLLAGGVPCQPFSKAGYWVSGDSRRLDDPRAATLKHFLRVLRDTLPECYLLENVPGLSFEGKDEGLTFIERRLDAINRRKGTRYTMSVAKLNAADFGIPQVRERVFVIGHRDGKGFAFPTTPTHFPPGEDRQAELVAEPYLTAWDAIAELEDDEDPALRVTGKWADLLPSIPEGKNYLWHTSRGRGRPLFGWRTRYWTFLLKLRKDRPASTLQAQPGPANGPFHWRSRRLSTRELCRLQTIPDDYKVPGSVRTAQRLLGNAVPSALAELLGKEIRRQLFGDVLPEGLTLLPKRAVSIPGPERPARVPAKYLHLLGRHAAHPGEGRGPGAARRRRYQKS